MGTAKGAAEYQNPVQEAALKHDPRDETKTPASSRDEGAPQADDATQETKAAAAKTARRPPYSRQLGGLMFALGISWCASTEYVVLRAPEALPWVYVGQIIPLLIFRYVTYYRQHWHHYTLELCYFSNALFISDVLFLISFGLLNGPVLMANIAYRCSMLMSDLQRFISWYMHVMPAIVTFVLRWMLPPDVTYNVCRGSTCLYDKAPVTLLFLALACCVGHAIVYTFYIWRVAPAKTRAHPEYDNSYLYMSRKVAGSPLNRILDCLGIRFRILSFTLFNQAFNAMCIVLTYAAWVNQVFHLVYLLTVVFATAYYAGTYYDFVTEKAERSKSTPASPRQGVPLPQARVSPALRLVTPKANQKVMPAATHIAECEGEREQISRGQANPMAQAAQRDTTADKETVENQ